MVNTILPSEDWVMCGDDDRDIAYYDNPQVLSSVLCNTHRSYQNNPLPTILMLNYCFHDWNNLVYWYLTQSIPCWITLSRHSLAMVSKEWGNRSEINFTNNTLISFPKQIYFITFLLCSNMQLLTNIHLLLNNRMTNNYLSLLLIIIIWLVIQADISRDSGALDSHSIPCIYCQPAYQAAYVLTTWHMMSLQ